MNYTRRNNRLVLASWLNAKTIYNAPFICEIFQLLDASLVCFEFFLKEHKLASFELF